jgi:hypothetical protein
MVAVRDTSPRRTKDISETLNKNVPPLTSRLVSKHFEAFCNDPLRREGFLRIYFGCLHRPAN